MGIEREDGSVQSANIPDFSRLARTRIDQDFAIYRCMIIATHFVNAPDNLTIGNQQVSYEAIILGGALEGQVLQNVKSMSEYGGQYNYSEKIWRPVDNSDLTDTPIASQTGDIVYVGFLQGNNRAPVIFGGGVSPLDLDFTGATQDIGFVSRKQYNGIYEEIDKNGNFTLLRKGGVLNSFNGVFVPNQTGNVSSFKLNGSQIIHDAGAGQVTSTTDGAVQSWKTKTASGGEVKISKDRVAIGNDTAELFDQLSKALQKVITFLNSVDSTHTHLGNLGYSTSPPESASQFTQLGTDLTTIKTALDSIKGTL